MNAAPVPHWADVLTLREEVTDSDGSVGELQMSLHKAVYKQVDVPYRRVDYYVDITQPTPNLLGFFGRVARRLGSDASTTALFHLDQGMGGGKSHALVGLHHLAHSPAEFFSTDLGRLVQAEAETGAVHVDLAGVKTVVLTADYFSPGRTNEVFGPATSLFERFIWSLVDGDMDRYHHFVSGGPNKGTLQAALADAGGPVLILLDELMDYVLQLSDVSNIERMPNEKAFLNALMDACDDVPRVAFVIVMIRSELDERGYPPLADDFRAYVAERLVRNGTTVAVTEAQDFASIIRRRLFETRHQPLPTQALAKAYAAAAHDQWGEKVLDKLGPNRGLTGFAERLETNYPFHPELMRLVQQEWSQVQNFQRVRSTVAIFARTALHWVSEHRAGRWSPTLIGVGDVPLTVALEQLLSSGLLMNNDRAIQGYRSVATTDITSTDAASGRAVGVDTRLRANGVTARQAGAAVRMATAMFCYSIVARPRGGRGATKAELTASLLEPVPTPPTGFSDAEEVFNALTGEEGLGALEITTPPNAPARYYLSIKQTLRMYFTAAQALVDSAAKERLVWETAQKIARKGPFDSILFIDAAAPVDDIDLEHAFEKVDSAENRLVVLDPQRWTLLNGKDAQSRAEITSLLGLGPTPLRVDNAASCVVACVNTQRRDIARKRAGEVLAWQNVIKQIGDDEVDELREANSKLDEARGKLKRDIERAFQHYTYLVRAGNLVVEFRRFNDDAKSSLLGEQVWAAAVDAGRATVTGGLSASYVAALLDSFDRSLTLKEIVQSFYKNPSFPLVPSTDEIRRAVFSLLAEGWELVDSDRDRLEIATPYQLSINSINQTMRRQVEVTAASSSLTTVGRSQLPAMGGSRAVQSATVVSGQRSLESDGGSSERTDASYSESVVYKRYIVELTNRSLTSPDNREQVWQLLRELAKVLDIANSDADHQLLNLSLTLTTAEGKQGQLEAKAQQAGARVRVEDDDF